MSKQNTPQTNKAIELLQLGFNPVKLGASGDYLKIPILTDWQVDTYSLAELATWPAANNIGIRCGLLPDGRYLYVFDFDKYAERIFSAWLDLAKTMLPHVAWVIVATGKGYHVYVTTDVPRKHGLIAGERVPDPANPKKWRTDVLIEVRGDRQQVVSSGSKHPTGGQYELIAGDLAHIPTVTSGEYSQLLALAAGFDLRPANTNYSSHSKPANVYHGKHSKPASKKVELFPPSNTGDLTGVRNCLDYARQHIAGEIRKERDGEFRVTGNGGLLINDERDIWHCHSEQVGGGLVGLIAWHKNISVPDVLAMVGPPKKTGNDQRSTAGHASNGQMAGELWPGAVMSAPMQSHFTGNYPHEWTRPHTCDNYMKAFSDENGMLEYKRHTLKLWRTRRKDGLLVTACPGCQHDYVMMACWQMEVEAGAYAPDEMPFRYQILGAHQAKKLIRDARQLMGAALRYWRRPLMGGRVALVHNIGGIKRAARKAHDLPSDRANLHALFMNWVEDADSGRTSHSKGWGGDFKGTRGDGRADKAESIQPAICIITEYAAAHKAMAEYLQVEHVPQNTGIHITKFVDILEAMNVNYGVKYGKEELEKMRGSCNVHRGKNKQNSLMYVVGQKAKNRGRNVVSGAKVEEYAYARLERLRQEQRQMAAI